MFLMLQHLNHRYVLSNPVGIRTDIFQNMAGLSGYTAFWTKFN